MATYQVTNMTTYQLALPSPFGGIIQARGVLTFTDIPVHLVDGNKELIAAVAAGKLALVVTQDPNVPNTLEGAVVDFI